MPKLMSYHFDCGNSNDGPVGCCFRVRAYSREEATLLANKFLDSWSAGVEVFHNENPEIEYCNVYFGNVTEANIDDEEEATVEP